MDITVVLFNLRGIKVQQRVEKVGEVTICFFNKNEENSLEGEALY